MENLCIAILSMNSSADTAANCKEIEGALKQAKAAGADALITPECALSAYPSAARDDLSDINWCHFADHEDLLHIRAEQLGLRLFLGSASPAPDTMRMESSCTVNPAEAITNDVFICGQLPIQRYRKQNLTPIDQDHFIPGQKSCIVEINGWKLGVLICYDVRFPQAWGKLLATSQELDAFIIPAHLGGPEPDPGSKGPILQAHFSSRAAETASPVVLCNTGDAQRWLESGAWDCRGVPQALRQDPHIPELRYITLKHRNEYHPWYRGIHETSKGQWAELFQDENTKQS